MGLAIVILKDGRVELYRRYARSGDGMRDLDYLRDRRHRAALVRLDDRGGLVVVDTVGKLDPVTPFRKFHLESDQALLESIRRAVTPRDREPA